MRSIRVMLLVAVAAVATAAFAAPSIASASEWTEEGKPIDKWGQWVTGGVLLKTEPTISVEGKMKLNSVGTGGIECSMTESLTLIPGKPSAYKITSVSIPAASCVTSGLLKNEKCTVSAVNSSEMIGHGGTVLTNGELLGYFNVIYSITGSGKVCTNSWSTLTLFGEAVNEIPKSKEKISSWEIAGKAKANPGNLTVSMTGNLNVTGADKEKYGTFTVPPIKLSGYVQRNNSVYGLVGCSETVGYLVLEPGGVGQITSLNSSHCHGSTNYFCGNESSISANAPWSVINEGTYIKIPSVSLAYHQPKAGICKELNETLTGELSETPFGSVSLVTVTLPSGTLYNEFKAYWNFSGELNWTPSGVYGLK